MPHPISGRVVSFVLLLLFQEKGLALLPLGYENSYSPAAQQRGPTPHPSFHALHAHHHPPPQQQPPDDLPNSALPRSPPVHSSLSTASPPVHQLQIQPAHPPPAHPGGASLLSSHHHHHHHWRSRLPTRATVAACVDVGRRGLLRPG